MIAVLVAQALQHATAQVLDDARSTVTAAWIAGAASISAAVVAFIAAVYTARSNRRVEYLRDLLERSRDVAAARRDYEYDALKRLYAEAQPLLFQMSEASKLASERISDLAKRARRGQLGAEGWMTDKYGYFLPSALYMLLAPTALFYLLRDRLTLFDLSLDENLELSYTLSYAAYDAWSDDFVFARQAPRLTYDPNETQEWQGFLLGEIDRPVRALVDSSGKPRVITYADFEDQYNKKDSRLSSNLADVKTLFEGFSPATHPVLWRILVSQFFVYRALQETFAHVRQRPAAGSEALSRKGLFDKVNVSDDLTDLGNSEEDVGMSKDSARIGRRYLAHVLFGDGSFQSCTECRKCTGDDTTAQAHGV